jgi:hypothetical protein
VASELSDGDVTVSGHEAQSEREAQLTVADTSSPEATKKSAVTPVEHRDAMSLPLRHHDDVIVAAHAKRIPELTHANEAVEVEARRQHLHAVVDSLYHEHVAVGCDP